MLDSRSLKPRATDSTRAQPSKPAKAGAAHVVTAPGKLGPAPGKFTQIDTVTINGEVVADFTHTPANRTYSVNPDCTGTFTIDFTDGRPPVVANFVVVNNGCEIDTVVISAGGNQGILATGSVGKKRFCGF